MVRKLEADKPQTKAQERQAKTGRKGKPRPQRQLIPVLPKQPVDPSKFEKPTQRSVAAVNMRLAGTPYHAIAETLGYKDANSAEAAVIAALADMYPVETWETLRQMEAARAELAVGQAMAMASADYFVDADDPKVMIPNSEKRLWHDQLLKAIDLHSRITGAKAPTRIEVSADMAELNQMAQILLSQSGAAASLEASIWDTDDIPELEVLPEEPEG